MPASNLLRNSTTAQPRRRAGAWLDALRRGFTVLIAFAFLSQAFVVQTHVHGFTQETLTALSAATDTTGKTKGKLPALPDEKNCPLCRLATFVGSCVVPILAIPLPADIAALLPVPEPVHFALAKTSSHSWQVRAPPR